MKRMREETDMKVKQKCQHLIEIAEEKMRINRGKETVGLAGNEQAHVQKILIIWLSTNIC